MDNWPDGVAPEVVGDTLSYDDNIAYEEQISNDPERASLANRIGSTKVYLLSETSIARAGKRKHAESEEEEEDTDDAMDEGDAIYIATPPRTKRLPFRFYHADTTCRANALLLQGPPISHLPTARLFAYAKHFNVEPMGLEWVDDNTCVFVFPTKASARMAHRHLRKSVTEDADAGGFLTAKPIPITFWPPEERINSSLGKGEGLRGAIRMRWALNDDVKKKGARQDSAFYKKHGRLAGKEVYGGEGLPPAAKRRRGGIDAQGTPLQLQRAQLDDELDQFLAEDDEPSPPASPPSKMRSDYISTDGRTLLERTSVIRAHLDPDRPSLADRLTAPLPRRARNGTLGRMHSAHPEELSARIWTEKLEWGPENVSRPREGQGERRRTRGERRGDRPPPRPKMTQQELDDEMDAFLNQKE
ncbi:hypothetical protein D9615_008089 [Tricholomella constricta]|uniref:Chromatin target of PRMT1 protein C-terminal domain-containing protein n=1 Tax=Tricholomella constricta TaxID=117010 RepID=A0A8H5GVE7_9AGAR|nr:hypothetical protein D9615_008089 [Tricholomella constricta]